MVFGEGTTELIPGLPEEIAVECLLRIPYGSLSVARAVCRRWRLLVEDAGFFYQRKRSGHTRALICLVQALPITDAGSGGEAAPAPSQEEERRKSGNNGGAPAYGITLFDPETAYWGRLPEIPEYPSGLPLFCHMAGAGERLVAMGGWDPVTWESLRAVWVFDFCTGRWRRGADMPAALSFFACAGTSRGLVFIAGGHDGNKNAQRSAWAYRAREDAWEELPPMADERDECEGLAVAAAGDRGGAEGEEKEEDFWVVSGYATDGQGRFSGSAEAYCARTRRWRRVEGAWPEGRCPRGCAAGLVCWAEDATVRTGTCAVVAGRRVLVSGSAAPETAAAGFYWAEVGERRRGRLEAVRGLPEEFSTFVQSGCCIEI
ncbi:unnamed protein product [Spirodela intermedia]|uniref:F-box domain-containing protein n=1 Tax=Spirodela intermedia TaxID=51605 RepID=A0A7I8JW80_SPIIN|nr:unnamed protein product [Spirodela intermedia]